nr:NADH dehydrogenase subunit 4 [Sebastapistes fowleri]
MMKVIIPTLALFLVIWMAPKKWLWTAALTQSLIISTYTISWLNQSSHAGWTYISIYLGTDPLSAPLLVLTCWLLPLTIISNQHQMQSEPEPRQRIFLTNLACLQLLLIMAFCATEMMMFYIMFEATLIPTLMIITRWGNQKERLNAGIYFMFYTLVGSMPLLVALMLLYAKTGSLSLIILQFHEPFMAPTLEYKLWWIACLGAFLVKMPLYGVHLWLPKAHVEAPIAGSMILAAVLLKLGGYGMIRMMVVLGPSAKELSYPFIIIALWGVIMTSATCLRQTDLKSLIAYSSVSHMGLVVAGILVQTPWGLAGSLILMIAHGLTSSALFCLANTSYERTHSRTLLLARGMQMVLPLMASWWFLATLANLALPPLPNLMAELMIITALFSWSPWTLALTGLGTLITASYSLYMFLMTQRGPIPPHIMNLDPTHTREHLLIALHLLPLILLILKPELVWGWVM